ncbi:MAG: AMP-binding protein [Sphingomonadaceae bacterium]|uniref:phenylacetate--CoA ligase family protein n=1 Tax=Thermaurantiacus sp. TaxID=2820283 RepID=UPI00298F028F|nr:AMP-binding protein [Thermaurantiacus sp.]MCS6987194.1 AMP-binding protein [Sphingomonadaceae bacterium]MDW8415772.1 AMP-binding protein [Thermaurantiacus sp.]
MTHPDWYAALDARALKEAYPMGEAFVARYTAMSRDELRHRQERDFALLMRKAWTVPFYRRRWQAAGIEPGDIRSLDDLPKLPAFDKADLMASIARHPPLGDFHGLPPEARAPVVLHTTSGTTGRPQPLLFGPWGREVANVLVARMAIWQGLEPSDVVHSVYGHGMINGGHYIREAYTRWTGCLFLSAGTGVETRSARQVELMRDFGVTVLVGFVDYIRKLAKVARDAGLEPGRDIPLRMIIGHLGAEDRAATEAAWGGARAYDWYGVGDTGAIAGEGPDRDGLYVWEDAHVLEIADVATGRPLPEGEPGDMIVTCLYKRDVAPIVRFNTHDVSAFRTDANSTGMVFRRIRGFLGRSDNMVKLKGINVFPHAIAAYLEGRPELTGEYVCRLTRDPDGADRLTVVIEHQAPGDAAARAALARLLRERLGVEVGVELVPPGATAPLTEIEVRQKPLRLRDERRP